MRTINPDELKVFRMAERGMALKKAFEKCGSPTSWANVLRQWNERQALAAPATAPAATTPAGAPKRSRSEACSSAAASARTGPLLGIKMRRTSVQLETVKANKAAFWTAYKAAHKAATLEYAANVARGIQRRKGCTPEDVAAKLNNTLSPTRVLYMWGVRVVPSLGGCYSGSGPSY